MTSEFKSLAEDDGSGGDSAMPKDERPLLKSESSVSESTASASGTLSSEDLDRVYAPFVRRDIYGTMGCGEMPVAEKVKLGIAAVTLVPIRLVIGVSILVVYYLICRSGTIFSSPNREDGQEDYAHMTGWRRKVVVACGRFSARAMLFTFGFYRIHETRRSININNEDGNTVRDNESSRPGAIVSNHISYVDILYHMSSSFPSFVAKRSVASLPLVGLISKCLGCVYVQRESKSSDFRGVSGIVTERIKKAHEDRCFPMMLLFPEGTTTNGDYLLPFKSGAFLANMPILPVIIRYPYRRLSPAWDSISGGAFASLEVVDIFLL